MEFLAGGAGVGAAAVIGFAAVWIGIRLVTKIFFCSLERIVFCLKCRLFFICVLFFLLRLFFPAAKPAVYL